MGKRSQIRHKHLRNVTISAHFGSSYIKTGTIQKKLAWPPCQGDMQICAVLHIKKKKIPINVAFAK